MTMRSLVAAVTALGLAAGAAPAAELKFSGDASKIEFVGTKKDGSHTGGFKQFAGTIDLPADDPAQAAIKVEIQVSSMYTDTPKLTNHLKSPDFFDVRTHPTASFVSTAIKAGAASGGTHTITGNLTLHGVTKSVTFPATVKADATGVTIESAFTLPRKEFGMTYGDGMINNDVTIKLAVKAAK
jgi:polyisoprenoid-binding protein YceI